MKCPITGLVWHVTREFARPKNIDEVYRELLRISCSYSGYVATDNVMQHMAADFDSVFNDAHQSGVLKGRYTTSAIIEETPIRGCITLNLFDENGHPVDDLAAHEAQL